MILLAGIAISISLVMMIALLVLAKVQNRTADITHYELISAQLPEAFEGVIIAQVSDYHGDNTCREQIVKSLRENKPDMIAITGDLLDPRVEEESLSFAAELVSEAPVYYVTGNHEARMENYAEMESILREKGITVLRNESVVLERGGERIYLAGADDPAMNTRPDYAVLCAEEGFTVLLSHRPELLEQYAAAGADVVLAGHAHGGQFRTPNGKRGLIAPEVRLMPEYTQGVHEQDGTLMVISRGIGNRYFPPRLFNPPELVYIRLHGK